MATRIVCGGWLPMGLLAARWQHRRRGRWWCPSLPPVLRTGQQRLRLPTGHPATPASTAGPRTGRPGLVAEERLHALGNLDKLGVVRQPIARSFLAALTDCVKRTSSGLGCLTVLGVGWASCRDLFGCAARPSPAAPRISCVRSIPAPARPRRPTPHTALAPWHDSQISTQPLQIAAQ